MKNLTLILTLLTLISCSGNTRKITMTIIDSNLEVDMLCSSKTNRVTLFRGDNGEVDKWCGYWGEEGNQISGYWISGKQEWIGGSKKNGFQRNK